MPLCCCLEGPCRADLTLQGSVALFCHIEMPCQGGHILHTQTDGIHWEKQAEGMRQNQAFFMGSYPCGTCHQAEKQLGGEGLHSTPTHSQSQQKAGAFLTQPCSLEGVHTSQLLCGNSPLFSDKWEQFSLACETSLVSTSLRGA